MMIKNLLEIDNLNTKFMSDQETVNAVSDVSINLMSGEVLGIVGESGAGKSTIGNAIIRISTYGTMDNGRFISMVKDHVI